VHTGQGLDWISDLVDAVLATDPPRALVVAPDLSGASEALEAAAAACDRPVLRLLPLQLDAATPFAALRQLVPDADAARPGDAQQRLVELLRGSLVIVDGAHWVDEGSLAVLVGIASRDDDVGLLVAHRPVVTPALAALDDALASRGPVVRPDRLDDDMIAVRVAARSGRPAPTGLVAALSDLTGGRLGLVDLLVDAWTASGGGELDASAPPGALVSPVVVEALRLRLDRLGPAARSLITAMAGDEEELTDEVAAAATGLEIGQLAAPLGELRQAGLLLSDRDRPAPVVAVAATRLLEPAEQRAAGRRMGQALVGRHGAGAEAARHFRAVGATTPDAVASYLAAAAGCERSDPAVSAGWYELAAGCGADQGGFVGGWAEVAALSGERAAALRLIDRALSDTATPAVERARASRAAAALACRNGRVDQALDFVGRTDDALSALLGAAMGLGVGRVVEVAPLVGDGDLATVAAATTARAASAVFGADPSAAVPLLFEAAAALDATTRGVAFGEAPHTLAVVAALAAGDLPVAVEAARRSVDSEVLPALYCGAAAAWADWVDFERGRPAGGGAPLAGLPPRDAVVAVGGEAGRARRSGDLGALHDVWQRAEPLLVEVQPDAWLLGPVAELAAAAARLDPHRRAVGWLDAIDDVLERIDAGPPWWALAAWARLQVAVAADDRSAIDDVTTRFSDLGPLPPAHEALRVAAGVWRAVLDGAVDEDEVVAAADALEQVGRRWDASRLVGQAAVRTGDAAVARTLLGRARTLVDAPPPGGPGGPAGEAKQSVLSERELEVARLVVDGRTHKEIGAQLFLSPKTVEHHVARIRTKLGAGSRAEMLTALRRELA